LDSDGFNFGLIAISDDDGETWSSSLPIIGRGVNQPSLVVRKDGSIDAYMRDDGDEPERILLSHSDDGGYSWTYAQKTDIPNPGASIEVLKLESGNWLLVYNDVDECQGFVGRGVGYLTSYMMDLSVYLNGRQAYTKTQYQKPFAHGIRIKSGIY